LNEAADKNAHGHGHNVSITIDGIPKQIRQGRYVVSDLKSIMGVSSDLELDEVVDGEFKALRDADYVNIKEHDVFVSHVRRGGAS
jgi:hypothetical protein